MRTGVRIALDVGQARIGLARSDASGALAVPLATVNARRDPISEVIGFIDEYEAIEVVIGLPLNLKNEATRSTDQARHFAEELSKRIHIPIRLVDERLSTVTAQAQLHESGKNVKDSRSVIDQAAAVIILQHALEQERSNGVAPGILVSESREDG